jgi:hypothetical protein
MTELLSAPQRLTGRLREMQERFSRPVDMDVVAMTGPRELVHSK